MIFIMELNLCIMKKINFLSINPDWFLIYR